MVFSTENPYHILHYKMVYKAKCLVSYFPYCELNTLLDKALGSLKMKCDIIFGQWGIEMCNTSVTLGGQFVFTKVRHIL